jgi:hypothetical protein
MYGIWPDIARRFASDNCRIPTEIAEKNKHLIGSVANNRLTQILLHYDPSGTYRTRRLPRKIQFWACTIWPMSPPIIFYPFLVQGALLRNVLWPASRRTKITVMVWTAPGAASGSQGSRAKMVVVAQPLPGAPSTPSP